MTRRTQAERSAETRAKIVRAVVDCIDELGFPKTTAAEITKRAGVSWGAVQHQFGGKDGILRAVLEDSFERFADRLRDLPTEDTPLEKRVSEFVDRAWEHFGSPHYRSTFEILLHGQDTRPTDEVDGYAPGSAEPVWQSEMFAAWSRIWEHLFMDSACSHSESLALQHYTVSVLTGISALQMLGGQDARQREMELSLLKTTLVGRLS